MGLAVAHAAVLVAVPIASLIAVGVWWNSNTIAHNFVHRGFFRSSTANRCFAAFQTVLLGIPQTLWRERHLAHHAGAAWRCRPSVSLAVDVSLILTTWTLLVVNAPAFFVTTYLPGYVVGLGLCAMHGYFEHAGYAMTTSHYGRLYNLVCFNDGYHCEHHAFPGVHWSELPARRLPDQPVSRWPAPLRWLELVSLNGLETLVLHSRPLQRFVVNAHARALTTLVANTRTIRSVAVIGGGLFPRSALVLRRILPEAHVVLIDSDRRHLDAAASVLGREPEVEYRHERFVAGRRLDEFDLVLVPLAFQGDRERLYAEPPAPYTVVHDWCWRPRGTGVLVSFFLLKRLNFIRR